MLREAEGIKRIIIKTGKTDLRLGIDKLASLIQMDYGLDPLEKGTLFLFCGNKRDRIKGLLYEGLSAGFCYPNNFGELGLDLRFRLYS